MAQSMRIEKSAILIDRIAYRWWFGSPVYIEICFCIMFVQLNLVLSFTFEQVKYDGAHTYPNMQ